MRILYKADVQALKALKQRIVNRDSAMNGGPYGEGARPPDGDDYSDLYNDIDSVFYLLGL